MFNKGVDIMKRRIKSANKKVSVFMLILFGMGCFSMGVLYGQAPEGQNFMLTLLEFSPFILGMGFLFIIKLIFTNYLILSADEESNKNEKVRYY